MNGLHRPSANDRAAVSGGIIRRAGWGLVDQMVSSGTNFAVGIFVVRTLPLEDFGAFSIAFLVYTLVMSVARAFAMEPLLIRYSGLPAERWRQGAAAATGASTGAACVGAVALILISAVIGGATGAAFLALGVTLPGLLLQDAWRLAFFAAGRGRDALLNDLAWAVFLVPAFILAGLLGASLFAITFAWGIAASGAAVVGVVQARLVPRPDLARAWWREHADLAPRFLAESLIRTGLGQVTMIAIGAIAGLAALGSIRAAQLVMSPVQVILLGASLVAVPEAVGALKRSLGNLVRLSALASFALAAACLTWGLVALLLPDQLGTLILGESWTAARAFLPAGILAQLGTVVSFGPGMILRAFANALLSLELTMVTSCIGFAVPVGAAFLGGLPAAWGLAAAAVIGGAISWLATPIGIRAWIRSRAVAENAQNEDRS
jgi:O-antigen/teichoic acid export membrane protein